MKIEKNLLKYEICFPFSASPLGGGSVGGYFPFLGQEVHGIRGLCSGFLLFYTTTIHNNKQNHHHFYRSSNSSGSSRGSSCGRDR